MKSPHSPNEDRSTLLNYEAQGLRPLSAEVLNISNKVRSNLFSWRGQFSPQLVEALLKEYAADNAVVLDPFVGSGTVLYEAGALKMPAYGAEINPAAAALAKIYEFINKKEPERDQIIQAIEKLLTSLFPAGPLFSQDGIQYKQSGKQELVDLLAHSSDSAVRTVLEALIVIMDFHKYEFSCSRLFQQWHNLSSIIKHLPYSNQPIRVDISDARTLPLENDSVEFVITSPPYINVFNYHQQYRASMEAIGWNLLKVARSEIGSNRKHRQNRFLTVVQYCLDMRDVFFELRRVCKQGCHINFVVGKESNVRKTPFFNGDIVTDIATKCSGFTLLLKQERVFKNKFGKMIYEDILHFEINENFGAGDVSPRNIARQVLENAIRRVPDDSIPDIYSAIDAIDSVSTSPIFRVHDAVSTEKLRH